MNRPARPLRYKAALYAPRLSTDFCWSHSPPQCISKRAAETALVWGGPLFCGSEYRLCGSEYRLSGRCKKMNSPRERLRNKVKEKLTRDESVYSMARKGQNGGSMGSVGDRAVRKAFRHLMPVLILCYLAAYLDRTNVGFAALHMNRDLGLSAAAFGFGSGLFFLSYFFLEVPSNLLLARSGARRWIARILFTWGCISGAMAFISGEYSFYVLRFLLGAAEAGFFPGVLFFFTLWFPAAFRARAVAFLLFSAPVALSFGGPISGAILGLDGVFGIAGWRWMFFLEALPAVIMCFVVLRYLPDRPADAEWLAPNERDWLEGQIASEEKEQAVPEKGSLLSALANPSVLLLGYVNFTSILSSPMA